MLFKKSRSTIEVVPVVQHSRREELERGEDCLGRRPRVGRGAESDGCFKAEEKDLMVGAKALPEKGRLDTGEKLLGEKK